VPDDIVEGARERLVAAGFSEVTLFTETPPRPDATNTGPNIEAA
jgi:hypothetical protein